MLERHVPDRGRAPKPPLNLVEHTIIVEDSSDYYTPVGGLPRGRNLITQGDPQGREISETPLSHFAHRL